MKFIKNLLRSPSYKYHKFGVTKPDKNLKKLNLCCGKNILKGYINTDMFKFDGVDKVFNAVKFPYPFKDNEFDEIYIRHFLNHISENDRMGVLDELYRVSKNGGVIKILVPFAWSNGSFGHIQHQSFFVKGTFNYYKESGALFDLKESKTIFRLLKEELISEGRFKRFLPFKNFFSKFLINIYDDIYYELKVIK